jgi:DNA-binding MarR family transcriptional regulator
MTEKDITQMQYMELGDEIIRLRNGLGNNAFQKLFTVIPISEYLLLTMLMKNLELHQEDRRVYLKEIAAELKMEMPKVSAMVEHLQQSGLVIWQHDGSGNDGTYITLSNYGRELMEEQRKILKNYFEKLVTRLGMEKTEKILDVLYELQNVMDEVIEEG